MLTFFQSSLIYFKNCNFLNHDFNQQVIFVHIQLNAIYDKYVYFWLNHKKG